MNGVNKVILLGNLGKDPDVFIFENGNKKVRLAVATSEIWRTKNNERVEHTEWHSVVFYRGLAEVAEKYLRKGNAVYIEGLLRTRSWEDEKGVKKYFTEVEAQKMSMIGGGAGNGKKEEAMLKGEPVSPSIPAKLEEEPEYDPSLDSVPF
ncbi:MAG: single-stranded DNA-binding protein [Bacteroidales bacterium]|jgi:single-strand DNA-binding protein|nr:single-stranded DNA-binding protein [Bacteroidales bacterium]